ncbi:MAG: dihydrofolate reductase [Bacteroidetes bacterium]|nr:dihydrofolate reductase [Bacteroidota bacterium]
MIISLIVAVAENGVIGKNNALPWHLPTDMKYFRDVTMGHCVIMGRKNYDSIPLKYRPLEGRTNIIVTRQKDFKAEGCIVVNSIEEGLNEARKKNESEVFIIGGAEIFNQALDIADKIYYTRIYNSFEGDVYFPGLDETKWKLVSKKDVNADEKNKFSFSFCIYEKANS